MVVGHKTVTVSSVREREEGGKTREEPGRVRGKEKQIKREGRILRYKLRILIDRFLCINHLADSDWTLSLDTTRRQNEIHKKVATMT